MNIIYSYGGGEYLYYVFNFIAIIFNGKSLNNIILVVSMLGGIWSIFNMYLKTGFQPGITWFMWFIFLTTLVAGPKTKVYIKDYVSYGNVAKTVDNVPYLLGASVSGLSTISHRLTSLIEETFSVPKSDVYFKYTETGSILGSKLIRNLGKVRVSDEIFNENLESFVQQCVVYDAMIGYQYTLKELRNTDNIWKLVSSNASQVLGFPYREKGQNSYDRNVVTCKEGAAKLEARWNKEIGDVAAKKAKLLLGYKDHTINNNQSLKIALLSKMGDAYSMFGGAHKSGVDLMKQQMMITLLDEAPQHKIEQLGGAYALTKARLQQLSSYQTAGIMAEEILLVMRAVFEALIYGGFILVYILALLPSGYRVLGYYFQALCWIQLWPPLYAILNFIMTMYANLQTSSLLGDAGLVKSNSSALIDLHTSISANAGWLSASVPYISFMFISRAGVSSFVHLANHLSNASMSSISNAAHEKASGNINVGNSSWDNMSFNNTNGFKTSLNQDFQSGQFSSNTSDGGIKMSNADNLVYLKGQGRTSSTFSTDVTNSDQFSAHLNEQYQNEISAMESKGEEYSAHRSEVTRDMAELINRRMNSESNMENISQDQSFGENKVLSDTQKFATHLSKKYGLTDNEAMNLAAGVSAKVGGDIKFVKAGVDGKANYSTSSGRELTHGDIEDSAKEVGYNYTLDDLVKSVKGISHNSQESEEKIYADNISASYEKMKSARESMSIHKQNSERVSNATSIMSAHSNDVRTVLNQDVLDFIANSGDLHTGEGKIGYDMASRFMDSTSGSMYDRKQEFLERYKEEKYDRAMEYIKNNDMKTPEDINKAFSSSYSSVISNDINDQNVSRMKLRKEEIQFRNNIKNNLNNDHFEQQQKVNTSHEKKNDLERKYSGMSESYADKEDKYLIANLYRNAFSGEIKKK